MAETNFASLTGAQKRAWSMDVMRSVRQHSFIMRRSGSGINSAIQRINELTKSSKGTQATITLVPDLEGDGVVGDTDIEGNEESASAVDQSIFIDQLRNANKLKGRMADQKSVVKFRETSRDLLAFWKADRIDQLASLTLSGIDFRHQTNGALRPGFSHNGSVYSRNTGTAPVGQAFIDLEFASDPDGSLGDRIKAPTTNRHFRWDAGNSELAAGDTTAVTAADTISYAALVELKAYAADRRLKSMRAGDMQLFHVWMHHKCMAKLKLDSDFLANVRNAGSRGGSNPLFSGAIVTVDGLVLHEFPHSFNTLGATAGTVTNVGWPGYKWGADADVDGNRVLMLGAQALAFADIGIPEWDERDHFDYGAKPGIATSKICGFLKPQFYSPRDNSTIATDKEDFGVIALDVAI